MFDDQRSYIDLNHTRAHSNFDVTNAKKALCAGLKGSTDRKSNVLPLSPLTRHITD